MVAGTLSNERLLNYMEVFYPHIRGAIHEAPPFVRELFEIEHGGGEWKRASKKSRKNEPYTLWDFWKEGADLNHLKGLQAQGHQPDAPIKEPRTPTSRFHLPAVGSNPKATKNRNKKDTKPAEPTAGEADDAQELIDAGYGHLLEEIDDDVSDEGAEDWEASGDDLVGRPPTDSEPDFELEDMAPPPTAREALRWLAISLFISSSRGLTRRRVTLSSSARTLAR